MRTYSELAKFYGDMFETKTRDSGEKFVCNTDDADPDLSAMARECHGDMLPDDFVYETIVEAFEAFEYANLDDSGDADRSSVMDEIEADVYTSDLTAWLNSNNNRVYYLGQVQEEFGACEDGFKLLSMAQYLEKREIYEHVKEFLDEKYDEQEEDEDQDQD